MKISTESLTATKTTVNRPCIKPSHHYASCIEKQEFTRLSAKYAKEGGENGSTGDVFWKFIRQYQVTKQF